MEHAGQCRGYLYVIQKVRGGSIHWQAYGCWATAYCWNTTSLLTSFLSWKINWQRWKREWSEKYWRLKVENFFLQTARCWPYSDWSAAFWNSNEGSDRRCLWWESDALFQCHGSKQKRKWWHHHSTGKATWWSCRRRSKVRMVSFFSHTHWRLRRVPADWIFPHCLLLLATAYELYHCGDKVRGILSPNNNQDASEIWCWLII